MDAQIELANIDRQLRAAQIRNTDAITATQGVITRLKQYEIPGAKNSAEFEELLSTEAGNANKAVGAVANTAKAIRELFNKK